MAGNLIQITDAGLAALIGPDKTGTAKHDITAIGLGNAAFAFDPSLKTLPHELKRITTFGGDNVAPNTVHVVMQDDTQDQYQLYSFGLYLDNGVLFGVYVQDTPILEKSPQAMMLLASDAVFTRIDATQLQFGPATFLNPPATETRQGVIEIATQDEVNAGTDDVRALTPKKAALRYMPFTGGRFTGPIVTECDVGDRAAHVTVRPPNGAKNGESRMQMYGLFAASVKDAGTRLVATVRAGFDNGAWGTEYLDIWLNKTGNDQQTDANQARAVRIAYGGRVLIGNVQDDGQSALQLGGSAVVNGTNYAKAFSVDGGAGKLAPLFFGDGGKVQWSMFKDEGGTFGLNAYSDDGKTQNPVWRANRGSQVVSFAKRLTIGSVADDSDVALRVGGRIKADGEILVSRGNGEGRMLLGANDGYFYATVDYAGWWSPTVGDFGYDLKQKNLFVNKNPVYHRGNLTPLDVNAGGTIKGDIYFDPGKRIFLSEGGEKNPSLTFQNDGAPDTGLYHINDGSFGVTCNGLTQVRFTPDRTVFDRPVQGPKPNTGDNSNLLTTTSFVVEAILNAQIGQIVYEPRTSVRAGYLALNGAELKRSDYPVLWAYAQSTGALVPDNDWRNNNRWGCFSSGDGNATFRLPEIRGEFIRCWANGRDDVDPQRQIGSFQDSQNRSHSHGASASAVGDHIHNAWTDGQGAHAHGGGTAANGDHDHEMPSSPGTGQGAGGSNAVQQQGGTSRTRVSGNHNHAIPTDGTHSHNVGIGAAGGHGHVITVNGDGGNETRPRNVAMLAMIRAY